MNIIEKLQQPFKESELEWRPQSQGINGNSCWLIAIPYVQARAIQNRLDQVFGFDGWQVEYRADKTSNIICKLSVFVKNEKYPSGQWIYKEDGASETNIEAFKGGISSALKRVAASGYGIGRYLYDLKPQYADCKLTKQADWNKSKDNKSGKYIYWKTPKIQACKKITEPIAQTEPETDPDFELWLGIDACDSVQELNSYWKQYHTTANNIEAFNKKCANRKEVLNAN